MSQAFHLRNRNRMVECGFPSLLPRCSDIVANTPESLFYVSQTSTLGNETDDHPVVAWDYQSIP